MSDAIAALAAAIEDTSDHGCGDPDCCGPKTFPEAEAILAALAADPAASLAVARALAPDVFAAAEMVLDRWDGEGRNYVSGYDHFLSVNEVIPALRAALAPTTENT